MKALQHLHTGLIVPENTDLPIHKDPECAWTLDAGFVRYALNPERWRVVEIPEPMPVKRPHDMTLIEQKVWRHYAKTYGPLAAALALPRQTIGFNLMQRCFRLLCPPVTPVGYLRRFEELTGYAPETDHFTTQTSGVWNLHISKFIQWAVNSNAVGVKTAGSMHDFLSRDFGEEAATLALKLWEFEPSAEKVRRRSVPKTALSSALMIALCEAKSEDMDIGKLSQDVLTYYGNALGFNQQDAFASILGKAGGR